MRRAVALFAALLPTSVMAQDIGEANLGEVVLPDQGWVSDVWAGPRCDFFLMQPSQRTWAIPRGSPMHDGVLAGAQANLILWRFYQMAPQNFHAAPTVIVSASTSPAISPGQPAYNAVMTWQPSQTLCGGVTQRLTDAAIAILPTSNY